MTEPGVTEPEVTEPEVRKLTKQEWERRINKDWCRECRNDNIFEEFSSGDVVCGDCGLVLGGGIVDTRSEWRTFSNDDDTGTDPNRVGDGGNTHLFGAQLGTSIAADKGGIKMSATHKKVAVYTEDDKLNERLRASHARIDAYCGHASLSRDVQDTAKQILKQLVVDKVGTKFSVAELAAILFLALKQRGVGRSFAEVLEITGCEKKPFSKAFKKFQMALQKRAYEDDVKAKAASPKIEPTKDERARSPSPLPGKLSNEGTPEPTDGELDTGPVGIKSLLPRYISALKFPAWSQQFGDRIADAVCDSGIMGARAASTTAPATVFILGCLIGHPVNVDVVASVSGRRPVTIRNAIALFLSNRQELVASKHWPTDARILMSRFPTKVRTDGFGATDPCALPKQSDVQSTAAISSKKRKATDDETVHSRERKKKMPMTDRNFNKLMASPATATTPVVSQENKENTTDDETVPAPTRKKKVPTTDRNFNKLMAPPATATTPVANKENKENVVPQLPTPPYSQPLAGQKRKAEQPQWLERPQLPVFKKRKPVPQQGVKHEMKDDGKQEKKQEQTN